MTKYLPYALLGLALFGLYNREMERAEEAGALKVLHAQYTADSTTWAASTDSLNVVIDSSTVIALSLSHDLDSMTQVVGEREIVDEEATEAVEPLLTALPDSVSGPLRAVIDTLVESGRVCRATVALCGDLTREQALLITAYRTKSGLDSVMIVQQAELLGRKVPRKWFGCVGGLGVGYAVGSRQADAVVGVMCGLRIF